MQYLVKLHTDSLQKNEVSDTCQKDPSHGHITSLQTQYEKNAHGNKKTKISLAFFLCEKSTWCQQPLGKKERKIGTFGWSVYKCGVKKKVHQGTIIEKASFVGLGFLRLLDIEKKLQNTFCPWKSTGQSFTVHLDIHKAKCSKKVVYASLCERGRARKRASSNRSPVILEKMPQQQ